MAKLESEISDTVILLVALVVVGILIWLYFTARNFDPFQWLTQLLQQLLNLFRNIPTGAGSQGVGIFGGGITGGANGFGDGSSAFDVTTGASAY